MTTPERIQSLRDRRKAGPFTIQQLEVASGFHGVWHALEGESNPSAVNMDKMEAGMDQLEREKDK
jgi:hypothetical protein